MPEALQLLYDFEDAEVEVQGSFHDPSETSETLSSRVARDNPSFPRAMGVSDHVFAWYLDTALSAFCQAVQCDSDSRTMFNEKVDEAQTNTIPDSPFRGEIGLQSHLWSAYFKIVNYMTSSELPAAASFNPRSRRVPQTDFLLFDRGVVSEDDGNRVVFEVKTEHTCDEEDYEWIHWAVESGALEITGNGQAKVADYGAWGNNVKRRVERLITQMWCQMASHHVRLGCLCSHDCFMIFFFDNDVIWVSRHYYKGDSNPSFPCGNLLALILALSVLDTDQYAAPAHNVDDEGYSPYETNSDYDSDYPDRGCE